jgi:hypothetical protein
VATLADAKTLVITGRLVELGEDWIVVQSGKERLEIGTSDTIKYAGRPKVGDTVTVHYKPFNKPGEKHFRADPDYDAIEIEVTAGGSKK